MTIFVEGIAVLTQVCVLLGKGALVLSVVLLSSHCHSSHPPRSVDTLPASPPSNPHSHLILSISSVALNVCSGYVLCAIAISSSGLPIRLVHAHSRSLPFISHHSNVKWKLRVGAPALLGRRVLPYQKHFSLFLLISLFLLPLFGWNSFISHYQWTYRWLQNRMKSEAMSNTILSNSLILPTVTHFYYMCSSEIQCCAMGNNMHV